MPKIHPNEPTLGRRNVGANFSKTFKNIIRASFSLCDVNGVWIQHCDITVALFNEFVNPKTFTYQI